MSRGMIRSAASLALALGLACVAAAPAWATWHQVIDDNFSHANTSTGSAGTTTGVPTQGGWIDNEGGVWSIQSNEAHGVAEGTNSWQRDHLLRPTSENVLDERIVTTQDTNASGGSGGAGDAPWPLLRHQSGGAAYIVTLSSGQPRFYSITSSGQTLLGCTGSFTYTSGDTYTYDFSAVGAAPTALTITVTNVTTSTQAYTCTINDSTAGLQQAGQMGVTMDAGTTASIAHATTYSDATLAVSPTSVTVSTTGNSLTLTGTGTNWGSGTPGTPTFTASCGTITAQTVSSATAATLTYTAPGSAGSCTLSDAADAVTATLTINASATLSVSPTSVTASTTGNTLTLTGTSTSWSAGTPGSPTFTASGGTITAQSVSSTTAATLTYTAPGSAGTVTLTDPSTSATATLTINAAGATDFTFTPSSQTTADGVATGNFTITPNATPSSSTTISFSASVGGGTFTPSSLTFTTATAQTFTYTPAGSAATPITLTATASGGFSASHTATVNTTSTIAVNDGNWFWSPYGWDVSGSTSALSQDFGAYFKVGFTGTQVQVTFDVSALTGASVASGNYPYVRWSIDNGAFATYQLTSSTTTHTLATGLASGTHQLVMVYYGAAGISLDFWTTPVMQVKIDGLVVDGGAASAAPTLRTKRCLFYGDSITQGQWSLGSSGATPPHDATLSHTAGVAAALGCEYGNIGYGGTGWTTTASNVPPIFTAGNDTNSSWDKYFAGTSRLVSGALSPAPDYVFVNEGTNDGGASDATVETEIEGFLPALRTAAPGAWIFLEVPFNGQKRTALTVAYGAYEAVPDAKAKLIDLGTDADFSTSFDCTVNGVTGTFAAPLDCYHPAYWMNVQLGAMLAQKAQADIGGNGGSIIGMVMAPW